MPLWSAYVKTRARLPESGEESAWEALDALVDAVEADTRSLGASVAGEEDGASVFLSVDADTPRDARDISEEIVRRALGKLRLPTEANASQLYDAKGRFVP